MRPPLFISAAGLCAFAACSAETIYAPEETGGAPSLGGTTSTGGATGSGGASGGVGAMGGDLGAGGGPETGGTDAGGSGGVADSGSPTDTRLIPDAPTYLGTANNAGGCTTPYETRGFEPNDDRDAKHPLFLYFAGTNFFASDALFRAQVRPAANAVTEAMARRGFVALWVEYDDTGFAWASDHVAQLACLFGKNDPETLLARACALPNVDCDLGIATWGHSQGAYIANRAHDGDARVRAAWLTGYGGDMSSTMPTDRIRVVNGENDSQNGTPAVLNPIVGLRAEDCQPEGRDDCFRPDGSGWAIVRRRDCRISGADHCWFDRRSCSDPNVALEPTWTDRASTRAYALELNADWVAATARRP